MKIFELENESGEVFAFEVRNTLLSRKKAIRIIEALPGAKVVEKPKNLSLNNKEEFCLFEFKGAFFVIWEPWNDNSRYWIGSKPTEYNPNINLIIEHFSKC